MASFIKRSLSRAKELASDGPFRDAEFLGRYPALSEFLTCTMVDGEPRKTATLTIFFDHGQLKAFLNDRQESQSLCVAADTFTGLWESLEGTILSDDPGWRVLDEKSSKSYKKRS